MLQQIPFTFFRLIAFKMLPLGAIRSRFVKRLLLAPQGAYALAPARSWFISKTFTFLPYLFCGGLVCFVVATLCPEVCMFVDFSKVSRGTDKLELLTCLFYLCVSYRLF